MPLAFRNTSIAFIAAFLSWSLSTHCWPLLRVLGGFFVAGALLTSLLFASVCILSIRTVWPEPREPPITFVASFAKPFAWVDDVAWIREDAKHHRKQMVNASVAVSDSLDELLDWVLRDFVASWYGNISSSPNFLNKVDSAVRDVLIGTISRFQDRDIIELVVTRFIPIVTRHLKDFYEAEQSIRGKKLNRSVTETEELDLAIAAKYCDGNLHPAASLAFADLKTVQAEYLRKIVARLLPEMAPEEIIQSRATTALAKEVVSCSVMFPVLQLLSDPDTWNQVLEGFGRTMLQDRKTVRKLRAALDTHASPEPNMHKLQSFPRLAPNDDERKFERFIRAIRQCNDLSTARRFRSEVSSQLKRDSSLESQDSIYIRRLQTGKRILDQRVGMLSTVGESSNLESSDSLASNQVISRMMNASISEILHDTAGLSYFMEYMDRLRLLSLVQFWVVVDGLRNPLESDLNDELGFLDTPHRLKEADRLDMVQISEAYLKRPELRISKAAQDIVEDFLRSGRHATVDQYEKARKAMIRAQMTVQEDLQDNHLPNFRKSDLFYKLLNSDDVTARPGQKSGVNQVKSSRNPGIIAVTSITQPPLITSLGGSRTSSKFGTKSPSSTDLRKTLAGSQELPPRTRRSLDIKESGSEFGNESDTDDSPAVKLAFDAEPTGESTIHEKHMVAAMEEALSSIMSTDRGDDNVREPLFDDQYQVSQSVYLKNNDGTASADFERIDAASTGRKERPNLTSLGLVDTSSRIGFFRDNDLFGEEKFLEDERAASDDGYAPPDFEEDIQEAAPGDLGLTEAISALTVDIDKFVAQESIVDTLTRKAELTNNVAELRILGKSKSSLQREIRRKEQQRQQYIVQESDNSLFGRATINIKSIVVGKEDDGQEFALYLVDVNRHAGEHLVAATWTVARRYSEFHRLHQRLRQVYPAVRNLEFPRRRLVMKLQSDFLHRRRVSLENYIRELLRLPAVCQSRDLRAFLSQRPILSKEDIKGNGDRADIVSRLYNSVTDGMDEFLGNIPVLDQLSMAGQSLISAATSQYYNTDPVANERTHTNVTDVQEARTELEAFENQTLEPLVKPICDLFLEAFELNRSENWLRGRAVVIVLHQLLGGTVERKVRETASVVLAEESILKYISTLKSMMWPNGLLQRDRKQRTEVERRASRREASVVLAALIPELAGNVVGRANAQAASRRIFATVNNSRLNAHLVFRLLDEAVATFFP